MSLADMHSNYLAVRQHTVNQKTLQGQAAYVTGEARELAIAVANYARFHFTAGALKAEVRHEIADVILSTVTLAKMLDVTVEDCIAEKTEKDRNRG